MLHTELCQTRYGTFYILSQPDLICNSLRFYGEWAQLEIETLSHFIERDNVVLDVGSFIGTHARAFSNLVGPKGTVYAFEPQPEIFEVLTENCKLSEYPNIIARQTAIGARAGQVYLIVSDETNRGSTRVSEELNNSRSNEMSTHSLQRVDDLRPTRIDFMKIDVEGHELHVLEGAHESIEQFRPTIFMEANSLEATHSILHFCKRFSYFCFGVVSENYNQSNSNRKGENIYVQGAVELGLLLIPAEAQEKWLKAVSDLKLPRLETVDDLCLLLLQKPQYPSEVLFQSVSSDVLTIPIICSQQDHLAIQEMLANYAERSLRLSRTLASMEDRQIAADRITRRRSYKHFLSSMSTFLRRNRDLRFSRVSTTAEDHINLETVICTGGELQCVGWYFNALDDTESGEVIVHGSNGSQTVVLKTSILREDVAKVYGDRGRLSGFESVSIVDREIGKPRSLELIFYSKSIGRRAIFSVEIWHRGIGVYQFLSHTAQYANWSGVKEFGKALFAGELPRLYRELKEEYWNKQREIEYAHESLLLGEVVSVISTDRAKVKLLNRALDIIVPIFNGYDFLQSMFQSLALNTAVSHRVILVDDCSSDARIAPLLQGFARTRPNVHIITHTKNLGFVGAINSGADLVEDDFVILNTDVIVPPMWLERLIAPIDANPHVASVTPMSNAATICSFPEICSDNQPFGGLAPDAIDHWFQHVRTEELNSVIPTGVGFCMAIRGAVWREIGPFDRKAFGKGYGEENDWCQRAISLGYSNVVAANLFVYHKHGATFESAERNKLIDAGYAEVVRRHPSYREQVASYIQADPLRAVRDILPVIIAGNQLDGIHLLVDHCWGGGANHYREDITSELVDRGAPVLVLVIRPPHKAKTWSEPYRLEFRFKDVTRSFRVEKLEDVLELSGYVRLASILVNEIVTAEDPLGVIDFLVELRRRSGARLSIPVHDFYSLCPSYTLINSAGVYCALPDQRVCAKCLPYNKFAVNPTGSDLRHWRDRWAILVDAADEILCFSESSRDLVVSIYPTCVGRVVVRPHLSRHRFVRKPALHKSDKLRIGVVGNISYQKGSDVLRRLCRALLAEAPHAEVVVIGKIDHDDDLSNLTVIGPYKPTDLPDLIEKHELSFLFFPSIWPETFSYVTQELMELDVPLVVFDIGAPAERVRTYSRGRVIDLACASDSLRLCRELLAFFDETSGS